MESFKLDGLRPELKTIIQPYLARLLDVHKENIISVVLYGSATGKYFIGRFDTFTFRIYNKDSGKSRLEGVIEGHKSSFSCNSGHAYP